MLGGYMIVSSENERQNTDLQYGALVKVGVDSRNIYQDRKRRQTEGIVKAKIKGLYKGRRKDAELHRKVELSLSENKSYNMIISLLNCSSGTIAKVARHQKEFA